MENKDWLIGRKIFKLARTMTNRNNDYLKELDITGVQAASLLYIADNPQKTINDLRLHLGISHQAAQGLAKRMADKDLIEIQRFEKDGRQKILTLAPKGSEIRELLRGNARDAGTLLLKGVSEEDKEVFFNVLTKALDTLENDENFK